MIQAEWSCEISQGKLKNFINFAKKSLKPFYESSGCKNYELYLPLKTDKQFFPYQISEENRYIERLIFNNFKDFENLYDIIEKDPKAQEIVGKYSREFQVKVCCFKIFDKAI
jgi:hypothetical protein